MTDVITHEVFNQSTPLVDANLFTGNRALQDALRHFQVDVAVVHQQNPHAGQPQSAGRFDRQVDPRVGIPQFLFGRGTGQGQVLSADLVLPLRVGAAQAGIRRVGRVCHVLAPWSSLIAYFTAEAAAHADYSAAALPLVVEAANTMSAEERARLLRVGRRAAAAQLGLR